VIVAVIAVRMMETPIHEIIDMVAVGHGFMAAVGAVPMPGFVAGGVVLGIAAVRIPVGHGDHMLLGAAVLGMLKAAVIEVIDVAFVLDGEMATSGTMNVRRGLAGTALFGCHGGSFHADPSIVARGCSEADCRGK
jgi:hypothetical protein